MSKVEMRECPEAAFSELGKIWINQVKVTKDFRSIFMSHLSEYAFKCFELHSVPNLKAVINEEKCQRMIFTPLEYFICGEDPSDGFQKLQNANAPSQLCGRVFKFGEPTYSCRDCGYDSTCVLCINCFQKSIHKNHHYKMNTSGGGGVCDCGDVEAWKEGAACEIHQHGEDVEMEEDPIAKLPVDIVDRGFDLYNVVLNYCIDLICWDKTDELPDYLDVSCNQDTFATILFNDEVHTYEEVIRTLQHAIPDCSQNQALAYANTVDREGRSIVRTGSYSQCELSRKTIKQGTLGPNRKPLKCRVMHHKVVAHQVCAVHLLGWLSKITNYSDGLRRILCNSVLTPNGDSDLLERVLLADSTLWKVARAHTQKLFINTMLLDPVGKKAFAIHFTKHYSQIQKDFVDDDHEHSVSVTSLSVQLFTVPTLARMLILKHDVLEVIILSFMEHFRPAINAQGTFEFQKQSLTKLRRAYYMLTDLRYILLHKPTEWTEELRAKFIKFLDKFFYLLKCMQGMDLTTRKTGRHIETEPEWEAAFTLQFRVKPVYTLVNEWCSSDVPVFRTSILEAIKTLLEARKKEQEIVMHQKEVLGRAFSLFQYDVSSAPVSVHLPVSRFLAGLLQSADKYNFFSFWGLFGFESEDDRLKLFLMEYPLRTLVMAAQVQAGMWRRNGYAVINQVYHYFNVKGRAIMYDKDVVLLQVVASCLDSDYFLVALLDKFGLLTWSMPDFDDSKHDQEKLSQKMTIAESFFSLVIAIVGERYVPGVGRVSADDFMRREIIHKLCLRPMTHSELVKALPSDSDQEDEGEIDEIIESVSSFKKPGVTGRGLYDLKPECLKEYNPFFYHYTRIEQSKAEEQLRKRRKNDNAEAKVDPPPIPPEFCEPFSRVMKMLFCKTLVSLMNTLLRRASAPQPRAVTDLLLQQVLHLICLALHEEKRQRLKSKTSKFNFISVATAIEGHPQSLLKSLENLHGSQSTDVCKEHASLLDWIVKTFHEELTASQEKPQGVGATRPTTERSVSQEEEKAKRTRLAQERRAKIMAQMSALQKAFIKENAELLASMETEGGITSEPHHMETAAPGSGPEPIVLGVQRCHQEIRTPRYVTEPCILCQEQQEVNIDGRAVVMAAFVQRSTVLSRSRGKMFENGDELDPLYTPGDRHWGVHVSSCGHMMHSDCWQGFYKSVITKERRALRMVPYFSVDIARNEFLCPLCGCISNTVLPVMPALLYGQGESSSSAVEVTIAEFLSSMQDVVSANLSLISEEDEKKAKKPAAPLSERFQTIFQNFLKTGTKFSDDLKAMMRVFSQSCFMVGLGVDPNEEDSRVPILVWETCSYTIQSGESALRAEGKALFSGLASRQFQCMAALTRHAAVISGIFSVKAVQQHCLRLLSVLTPDAVPGSDGPSLLELDLFSLMVKLRLVLPSMLYPDSGAGVSTPVLKSIVGLNSLVSMDQSLFQVTLLGRLVQILLTTSSDLPSQAAEGESMEQEEPRDGDEAVSLASLWGKLRHWAGSQASTPHPMPQALLGHVRVHLLPFLRCSALFFHFLTEIPGPAALKDPNQSLLTEELKSLCRYLAVPSDMTRLLQWSHDSDCISSSTISTTFKRWCSHEQVKKTLATAGVESLGYSIEANHLLRIPVDYSEIINEASMFTCPNSDGDDSRAPALCLICGEMLCSHSYCCQTEVEGGHKMGACAAHAQTCGAGVGVFLRVRECQILLMANKNKGCFYSPPYLDAYGETDQGLRRGNPLYLCHDRYQRLEKLWLNHSVAEEVARSLESNRNLLSIDWANL